MDLTTTKGRFNRWRYVRAMMRAINKAQRNIWNEDAPSSKTNGLRVIKRFEEVNNIPFDPFDDWHVRTITGHGTDESFFRAARLLFDKYS